MVYLIIALVTLLVIGILLFGFAGFTFKGLPVLMYHKVITAGAGDFLSITVADLDRQFEYLVKHGYTPVFLSDVLEHISGDKPLPSRPVLITFDDGYKNNFTNLYRLLQKYHLKANIFLVADFIESRERVSSDDAEFLHVEDIQQMSSAIIEFGYHSFNHKSYNDLSISEIEEDIRHCKERFKELGITVQPCMAYTYGAYPKKDHKKRYQMFRTMEANGIRFAFRIGNRVNKIPFKNKMLIQRIDIRGDESFRRFKLALRFGKKILFK